jgi:two-component system sensor histidine kinase YesM
MITALNRMLRNSIYNGEKMNTIDAELNCVDGFVLLQRFSYHHPFEISYEVDDTLRDCLIPKMTFQPIVENALIHGFGDEKEEARIEIFIWQEGTSVIIEIRDNGKGITGKDMHRLFSADPEKQSIFSGIGIKNIERRLNLYFNGMAKLAINSVPEEGTKVYMSIPQRRSFQNS